MRFCALYIPILIETNILKIDLNAELRMREIFLTLKSEKELEILFKTFHTDCIQVNTEIYYFFHFYYKVRRKEKRI